MESLIADGSSMMVAERRFIDELMSELSEFFPPSNEMTSYCLDLTAGEVSKID